MREKRQLACLLAILSGTGLRIGEALAAVVDSGEGNVWDSKNGTITISSTETPLGLQNEPKTVAGKRVVDLHADLNNLLITLSRKTGERLFDIHERTARRHLAKLGVPGFHSMRRMRLKHLDNQNVPRSLVKFWAGHAAGDVTERYMRGGAEMTERKDWTEKAGLGFNL